MAPRFGSYDAVGDADRRKVLSAAAADFVVAAVVTLLLWPFPAIRLTLGLPWSLHAPLIVLGILLVYVLYLTGCAAIWGRTPAMYFLDLGLAPRPNVGAALLWGAGWLLALLPALLGARSLADPRTGLAARLSRSSTVATAAAAEGR